MRAVSAPAPRVQLRAVHVRHVAAAADDAGGATGRRGSAAQEDRVRSQRKRRLLRLSCLGGLSRSDLLQSKSALVDAEQRLDARMKQVERLTERVMAAREQLCSGTKALCGLA